MDISKNTEIRTLSISFDLPLFTRQIPQWRGAFVELAGVENDLFHNHYNEVGSGKWEVGTQLSEVGNGKPEMGMDLEDPFDPAMAEALGLSLSPSTNHLVIASPDHPTYHYRYPLIHYRVQNDKASIFAINEGIEALQMTLSSRAWKLNWEGKPRQLQITGMEMNEYYLRMLPHPKTYRLFKWLALNKENYERWLQCNNLVERVQLLERILAAHILAFAAGMGWELPERLTVSIQDIQQMQQVTCHGNPLLAFNITYNANVLLPPYIALGKAVSHGFGWQKPHKVLNHKALNKNRAIKAML